MKTKKYSFILLMVVAAGCASKLDLVNPNEITPLSYYKTAEQAQASVDAIYNGFVTDGAYNRMTPAMSDGRSDEMTCRSPWDALTTVSTFSLRATYDVDAFPWNAYYQIIYRANQTLANVPDVEMDEVYKNRILGQALALRALAYFNLTTMYDEVPLIRAIPITDSDFYPATATREELWAAIKEDLTEAIPKLPTVYADDFTTPDKNQNMRFTKGAAMGLLGRAMLYTKDYDGAIAQFENIFALNKYSLAANYADNFTDVPAIENANPETLFAIEFTTSTAPSFNWGGNPDANWRQFLAVSPTYAAAGFGFYDFIPSTFLYNEMRLEKTNSDGLDPRAIATILSYEPADGATKAYGKDWLGNCATCANYQPGDYFVKKFTNADLGKANENDFTSGINYPIIRLADVYLMYAECKNEKGDQATCAEYIQKVRDRVNLPDREAEFALLSQSAMRDQISHERVMELALESHRFYDIIRWGWLEDAGKLAMLKTHDIEFNNYESGKEYLKIPQGELDLNPNLKPNSAN